MLLLLAAGIGILGGLWQGGALRHFARLSFRWPLLFLIGLLVRALAFSRFLPDGPLAIALYLLALACLFAGMFANRHIAGIELVLVGLALNAAVILANGGAMPVSADALRLVGLYDFALRLAAEGQIGHLQLATPATQLRSLADIIPLSPLPGLRVVASVGDLFIATGTLIIFYVGTLRPPSGGTGCTPGLDRARDGALDTAAPDGRPDDGAAAERQPVASRTGDRD